MKVLFYICIELKIKDMEVTVFTDWGDEIVCCSFTDGDFIGIDLNRDGYRLGSILGTSIPDEDDEEAMDDFKGEVEEWIIDNEY